MKTVDQLKYLWGNGYAGYATFEPFAPSVQNSPTIADDLKASIEFIKEKLAEQFTQASHTLNRYQLSGI